MMNSDIDRYISELSHTVNVAQLNYDIWWIYKHVDTRQEFLTAAQNYPLFFQTSLHAHFVALLVALYRLYETRDDTYNFPSLLKLLKDEGNTPAQTMAELEALYAQAKPLWIKVNILRNKAFGHRSSAHTVEEVFGEAKVSPDELRDLTELTKRILNTLTSARSKTTQVFNLSARDDTLSMLTKLNGSGQP